MHTRLLTAPLRLGARLPLTHLACVVAGDAIRRHSTARRRPFEVLTVAATGTVGTRYTAERDLVREGHDRDTVSAQEFQERVEAVETQSRREIASLLTALGVAVHVPTLSDPQVAAAARVAFVRLRDEGMIDDSAGIIERCPRCAAPVDASDVSVVDHEAETFVLRFPFVDRAGSVDVRFDDLELLGGVVAVAAPPGSETGEVAVPVVGRRVPVIVRRDVEEPLAVVPAHDASSLRIARELGVRPVTALDETGTVEGAGPLRGLGRHGARATAADVAEAERAVASRAAATIASRRCGHCGTELMRALGEAWFLRMSRLGAPVPDVVREGDVAVRPPAFRDTLIEAELTDWPVATSDWRGVAAPVSRCEHCASLAVDTSPDYVCRKCAGTLAHQGLGLAPRFLAAIWPLASTGWPVYEPGVGDLYERTTAVAPAVELRSWAIPSIALSLRLVGNAPFSQIAVHPSAPEDPLPEDRIAARLALIAGVDAERGVAAAAALQGRSGPVVDVNALAVAVRGALEESVPAEAADALVGAIGGGLDPEQTAAVANIARPLAGT